jgi:hypothetical protein
MKGQSEGPFRMIDASPALPAEIWEDFQTIQSSGTQLPDK